MAKNPRIYFWKSAPFVRLLIPLVVGIIFQWYVPLSFTTTIVCLCIFLALFFTFSFFSLAFKYKFQWLQGLLLNTIIFCCGIFFCWNRDIRNNKNWFGNAYSESSSLIVKIAEPPIEKENSFKADAAIESISNNGECKNVTGNLLIYFSKKDSISIPKYGDKILISGGLQQIKNAGNPGGFNYSRYMIYQQTVHQVYLKKNNFVLLHVHSENPIYTFIFWARDKTIAILKKYVQGDKEVSGIAEALLIGYKEDLDKDVVQAYSNTGVVHIIAISGMHLGLIYVGLVWLFTRLPFIKKSVITKVFLILACLWLFSLITGASASVLRSAVMFTVVIFGKEFFKQATVYNSLASSAFLLLCYNPFLLWDVGFQLSYFAIVGIIWLQKPIQHLWYTKHKAMAYLWEMCSITIAAQILTLPICIYYFHQLPTTFLFTNLICVPLSTLILFAEISLIACASIPVLAGVVGKFIYVSTWAMNWVIDFFNTLPYSLLDKIYATAFTTCLLYGFVILLAAALLQKDKLLLKYSLAFLLLFTTAWGYGKINLIQQKKLVIYNVSKHTAIDFFEKNNYWFYGDSALRIDGALRNFNLNPTRVFYQADERNLMFSSIVNKNLLWQFHQKKILIIDSTIKLTETENKVFVDVLLICKNSKIHIADIANAVKPSIIVFDTSNSLWKIAQWKKECDELHLPYFSTGEQGAFVLDIN